MNIEKIRYDLTRLPHLLIGFIIMSTGIMLVKESMLGLFPWGVLHDGLSIVTPFSFGEITVILGFVVLIFSVIAFKTNVGIGTFLNIFLVGFMIDYAQEIMPFTATTVYTQILFYTLGVLLISIGRALYISSKLGAGPRDGMFVGVSRITQVDVKYVKPAIEIIVLTIGFILGGNVGVGTLILMVFSGYLVQVFFKLFGFDPKKDRQRDLSEYFTQKEKGTA